MAFTSEEGAVGPHSGPPSGRRGHLYLTHLPRLSPMRIRNNRGSLVWVSLKSSVWIPG